MNGVIRVLIADDHALVRAGLTHILQMEPDIRIVGEAHDGQEAISKARELKPDVVLLDIFMPRSGGLEALSNLRKDVPEARVLILTISEREDDLLQAFRLGAQGYLLKNASVAEVVEGVRRTAAGETVLSPRVAAQVVAGLRERTNEPSLSPREAEILRLMGEGLNDNEIGQRLFIGNSTVRTYVRRLLEKLHLRNRAEAIAYAARNNLNRGPELD